MIHGLNQWKSKK